MSTPYIVVGDKTDHGGVVIAGAPTTTIMGKPVARVGDLTICPRCKGTFPISSGDESWTIDGQAAARLGDKTACGATLISGNQALTFFEADNAAAKAEAASTDAAQQAEAAALTPTVANQAPDLCLECLKAASASGSSAVVRG